MPSIRELGRSGARKGAGLLFQARAHIQKDSDLDPLQQRADFKKAIQALPGKSP